MKLDMHCHTHEGSPDAAITLKEYIAILKEKGYDGMLLTEHDSYDSYRYYQKNLKDEIGDFKVFKGIEYDTLDAGHMIVITPSHIHLKVLEHRGLKLNQLIRLVHHYGGIVGPAHPYGAKFQSLCSTGIHQVDTSIIRHMDFVEAYNPCESQEANDLAHALARRYHKPVTGGSDSHRADCVGHAYTTLAHPVYTEDELIAYYKTQQATSCGGTLYNGTLKEHMGSFSKLLVYGFFPYNRLTALLHRTRRNRGLKEIQAVELVRSKEDLS